jgi:hypothetical protein
VQQGVGFRWFLLVHSRVKGPCTFRKGALHFTRHISAVGLHNTNLPGLNIL